MRTVFLIISLVFLKSSSFAQYIQTLHNEDGYLRNVDGSFIQRSTAFTEEGTSTLPAKNCRVILKTTSGKLYKDVSGRIDLPSGGFIYTVDDRDLMCALAIEQLLFDSCDASLSGAIFKAGYPSVDKQTDRSFYRILSQGKVTLLKYYAVKWQDVTAFNSNNTTRTYTPTEQFYMFSHGKMLKLEKNKENLDELLTSSKDYVNQNKLNLKKEEDLIKLFDYYNSL